MVNWGDDEVCFLFTYNVIFWWPLREVIMCYLLINSYNVKKFSISVPAYIILMLQYHILVFLFSRWWQIARNQHVFIGPLLSIGLKIRWPCQNVEPNPKSNTSFERECSKIGDHSELKELLLLQSNILAFLSRWWECARDWYFLMGRLLSIDF